MKHPARIVALAFAVVIALGTMLLWLPLSSAGDRTSFVTALFTATSAVCVSGLTVVSTSHWSTFGECVIMLLMQIGGFGIMTAASLLGLLMSRKLGLRLALTVQAETNSLVLGDVRRVVIGVAKVSAVCELVLAAVLAARFVVTYDVPVHHALYSGLFHAVSAFNNAGFSIYSDNLVRFVDDPFICIPVVLAVLIGSIGFPVIFELGRTLRGPRTWRWRTVHHWSLHTKITLLTTAVLLLGGVVVVTAAEWNNPGTLGPLDWSAKLLAGPFHAAMPRSVGFNTLDVGAMNPSTLLTTDILMFIGGGSASTAGGIKVTTFALLAFVILAEVRGDQTVHVMGRRLPNNIQRQAVALALMGVGTVMAATLVLLVITPFHLEQVLFEAVSAFSTTGMTTGVTAALPTAGHLVLVALMFAGRVGPATVASALTLRERTRRYELPEERPIVG